MQHAVPSRSVCMAYQGMTVPLPVSSLCSLSSSSSGGTGKELRSLVVNRLPTSEERQKDSGFQSQFTSEMSCNGSTASSPVCTGKATDLMERGELNHSNHEQPAYRDEDFEERRVVNNYTPSLELPTEYSHTSLALADAASLPVAAAYDTMDTPPPLVSAEPLLSAALEDAEPNPIPRGIPATSQSEKAGTTAAIDQAKVEEPNSCVRSTTATEGWSQVGRGRALMHILSTTSRPVGKSHTADCSKPEGQHVPVGPVLDVKEKEADSNTNTLTQPISVGPGHNEAVGGAHKTLKSSRKARVSLAIKFQGAHPSQHSAAERHTASASGDQVCLKTSPQVLMKPSDFTLPGARHVHMQSKTPEPPELANTQGKTHGLGHPESEGSRIVPACRSGAEEDVLHSQALSSDGDDLDFVETRRGRSANELEKSIAGHQRNIHRNQVCTHVHVSHEGMGFT